MALNIKRARKTIPFYEDRAIGEQVTAAQKALDEAKAKDARDPRLGSSAGAEAEKHLEEVKAAAAATVLDVTLEALPRKRWAEAEESNPPRDGDSSDETFQVNVDTILHEVLPLSVVEVKQRATGDVRTDITPEDWVAALDEIDDGQYSTLFLAINNLNRGSANPF